LELLERTDPVMNEARRVSPFSDVDHVMSFGVFIVETGKRRHPMHVRVQKWGNSLAVRIPKPLAEDAQVKEGTVLNLAVSEGMVVATPVKQRKWSLKQLLAQVNKENLHTEINLGPSVGHEIW
jgi:antitoxin MazE